MYTSTLIASAAVLAGTALASSPGKAVIVNACSYPVYLSAVPAQGGGQSETDMTLTHGQSWSQPWTGLTNGAGWSLKMSKNTDRSNPLQYEYTYSNGGDRVWFDLSCVDGNPWNGNWEITASGDGSCVPKQSFYRYATDDAFGMQDCPVDSDVTVTLCSGETQAESIVSAVAASSTPPAAPTSAQPTTPSTTAAPATTTSAEEHLSHTGHPIGMNSAHFYNVGESAAQSTVQTPTATTLLKATTDAAHLENGNVVIEVVTVVETQTAYVPGKRHVHHPEHPQYR